MGKGQAEIAAQKFGAASPHAEVFAVKNTFIEVDDDPFEDDCFESSMRAAARKRQVSEPVFSLARRVQADQSTEGKPPPSQKSVLLEHEEEKQPDGSSTTSSVGCQEPEGEKEPQALQLQFTASVGTEPLTLHKREDAYLGMGATAPWVQQQMNWAQMCGHEEMLMDFPMTAPQFQRESWANASDKYEQFLGTNFAEAVMPAMSQCSGMAPAVADPPKSRAPEEWREVTTVMMRNLPNRYSQQMLLEEVSNAGFSGAFDFFYLPIDPETMANKGYAFINFVEPEAAWRFKSSFEGTQMARFNSSKFVSVSPAALQGLEANYAHYSTARCSRGDPSTRPIFLREPTSAGSGLRQRGSRRGGQRHRGSGRSLVDVAAQQQQDEQVRRQQVQQRPSPAPPAAPAASLLAGGPQMVAQFCPYCGGPVRPMFRFCQFCGNAQARPGAVA
mmetsp:Transcript_18366/g.53038  ORF Transcript_18366/g.53038 Transcript_18366/m.53038 type:complete len:444 (-) Transcript_18366:250-1581(-)